MAEAQAGSAGKVVEQGSFVEVDYTLRVKETGELVDTTLEEVAKEAVMEAGAAVFEPRLTVVGRGMLLRAIEEEMVGMREDESKTFEIPPERAFGQRDPSKVRVIPLRRLRDLDQPIAVGTRLIIDGKECVVRSISSGRVQVDFNHHLAGKTLVCDLRVRRIITDDLEKVYALLHSRIPEVNRGNTQVSLEDGKVVVRFPKEVYLISGIQLVKRALAREILEHLKGVTRVVFVEEWDASI
ncbi:MAG: FKBP-type peptidyl-prolyl cis-trans isomerase [Candidatus Caldarchaeales archaeon]